MADFDGRSGEPAPTRLLSPNRWLVAGAATGRSCSTGSCQPEPARASGEAETAQEAEGAAARRRSTVREKVSFLSTAQPEAPAPVAPSQPEPPAPAPAQSAAETTTDTQPRKAGWWSRRFGGGE